MLTRFNDVHAAHGYQGVLAALACEDRFEHWLTRLAAAITLQRTGDTALAAALQTGSPPGDGELFSTSTLDAGRSQLRTQYLAA